MIQVIKFGAQWCGPCRVIAPTIKKLQETYNIDGSSVNITEVDIDQDPESASQYSIRNIPTLVFIKDGEVNQKKTGVLSESQIDEIINSLK
jgi:thioredoxin 1